MIDIRTRPLPSGHIAFEPVSDAGFGWRQGIEDVFHGPIIQVPPHGLAFTAEDAAVMVEILRGAGYVIRGVDESGVA